MVNNWSINNLFRKLPSYCLLCKQACRDGQQLCPGCRADLLSNQHACHVCAMPINSASHQACGRCQQQPPYFQRSRIPYLYASTLKPLVTALKFQRDLVAAQVLAELLAESVAMQEIALPEVLLPVPLHSKRLAERGFNQALEISKILSRRLAVPLDATLLHRQLHTPAQSNLSAQQRRKNLRGAFILQHSTNYQHVAIVDDVVTTGSTVNAIAKLLYQAGVKQIEVWALARAC